MTNQELGFGGSRHNPCSLKPVYIRGKVARNLTSWGTCQLPPWMCLVDKTSLCSN